MQGLTSLGLQADWLMACSRWLCMCAHNCVRLPVRVYMEAVRTHRTRYIHLGLTQRLQGSPGPVGLYD